MGQICINIKGSGTFPITAQLIETTDSENPVVIETIIFTSPTYSLPIDYCFEDVDPGDIENPRTYEVVYVDSTTPTPCGGLASLEPCQNCAEGYDPVGNICVSYTETIGATLNPPQYNAIAFGRPEYSSRGTLIYDNWEYNGVGEFTAIPVSNFYWINQNPNNTTNGPMNRNCIWTENPDNLGNPIFYNGQKVRVHFCIEVGDTKTYYLGEGIDDSLTLFLNGVPIMKQDRYAMGVNITGNTEYSITTRVAFNYWHIWPIELQAGENVLTVEVENWILIAGIAVEIYDASKEQIMQVTNQAQADEITIFRTADSIGEPVIYSFAPETGIKGYECPDGTYFSPCSGGYECVGKLELPCGEEPPAEVVTNEINIDRATAYDCDLSSIFDETIFTFDDPNLGTLESIKIISFPENYDVYDDDGIFDHTVYNGELYINGNLAEAGIEYSLSELQGGIEYIANIDVHGTYSYYIQYQVKTTSSSEYSTPGYLIFRISSCTQEVNYEGTSGLITTTGTTLSIPYTYEENEGDLIYMQVSVDDSSATIDTPDGWTLLSEGTYSYLTLSMRTNHYYKYADGTEYGNVDITTSSSANVAGILYRFTSVNSIDGNTYLTRAFGYTTSDAGIFPVMMVSKYSDGVIISGSNVSELYSETTTNNGGWSCILGHNPDNVSTSFTFTATRIFALNRLNLTW